MTATSLAVFPTKSAGPTKVKGPLTKGLVRLIFGDARSNTGCLEWDDESRHADGMWIECSSTDGKGVTRNSDGSACVSVPASSEVLDSWMDFTVTKLTDFCLNFTVFTTPNSTGDEPRSVLAHACILGEELRALIGVLRRPVISVNGRRIGKLTIDFLVVKPYVTPKNVDFENVWNGACSMRSKGLSISWMTGHRGMGKTKPHLPRENTVHSFIEATRSPHVNHIELDVQLSKDGHTVVYHDWFFRAFGRDKDEDRSRLAVAPYQLTFREFQDLYASDTRTEKRAPPCKDAIAAVTKDETVRQMLGEDKLRTLAQVCRSLPSDIGIMVEVKYPAPSVQSAEQIAYPERNELVDRILHDLYSVSSNVKRSIIFLSFEADICQMLALKQSTFPVFFSHCAARDGPCEALDPRCVSVRQGVDFAAGQGMQGMMYYEDLVRTDTDAVSYPKARGLSVVTYGARNMDPEWVARQIELGVDGVVADDAPKVAEKAAKLIGMKQLAGAKQMLDVTAEELARERDTNLVDYQLF